MAFATIIVIYNIFYISIAQRIKQFGLLAALGTTKKQIRKIVFREGLLLSIIGIPLGILSGYGLSFWLIPLLSVNELTVESSPFIVPIAVLVSLFTIIVSLRKPIKLASKISPIEAMRYNGCDINSKKGRKKGSHEINIRKMAYLNLGRNKKRTIMTMLSLTMSGMLFIIFSTILGSMSIDNLTKQDGVKREFTLSAANSDNDYSINPLNKDMISKVKSIDGVSGVYIEKHTSDITPSKDSTGEIYGYDETMLKALKKYIKSGQVSMDNLKNSKEIIVVCEKGEGCKYKTGERVSIKFNKFNKNKNIFEKVEKQFTVGAIVSDEMLEGSVMKGTAFITEGSAYTRETGDDRVSTLYIDIDKGKYKQVKPKLDNIINKDNRIYNDSYTEYKKEMKQQFIGIEIAAMSLVGIIALIGFLNLVNTMLTSILSRKKELGMLQAIGLSNTQMRKMLQIEGMHYAFISGFLSISFGTGLGYLSYILFKKSATYAEYEFPLIPILILLLVFVFSQVIITYLVVSKLKKDSIVERIRYNS